MQACERSPQRRRPFIGAPLARLAREAERIKLPMQLKASIGERLRREQLPYGAAGAGDGGDTLGVFREYSLGGSPAAALPDEGLFDIKLENLVIDKVAVPHLILTAARNLAADDVAFQIERNADSLFGVWEDVTAEFVWHSETQTASGQSVVRYRSPLLAEPNQYWRIRFLLR